MNKNTSYIQHPNAHGRVKVAKEASTTDLNKYELTKKGDHCFVGGGTNIVINIYIHITTARNI